MTTKAAQTAQDLRPADADTRVDAETAPSLSETVEAILITAGKVLGTAKLTDAASASMGLGDDDRLPPERVTEAIGSLNEAYAQSGRVFRIMEISGGWRLMTLPRYAPAVASLHASGAGTRLSRASLETLAIIAYRQPITRAQIDAIRGVASGEVIRTLTDRGLVTVSGRAEELGRPLLYATTRRFLESFGLRSVRDLPGVGNDQFGTPEKAERAPEPASDDNEPQADAEALNNDAPDEGTG